MKRIILLLAGILFLFTMSVATPTFAQGDPGRSPEHYSQGSESHHHHVKKYKKHHKKPKKHRKHHRSHSANHERAASY